MPDGTVEEVTEDVYDSVEADYGSVDLNAYDWNHTKPVVLSGVVPYGDFEQSHLYTLSECEKREFTDGVTDEGAVTYNAGETLALLNGTTDTVSFIPAIMILRRSIQLPQQSLMGKRIFLVSLQRGKTALISLRFHQRI